MFKDLRSIFFNDLEAEETQAAIEELVPIVSCNMILARAPYRFLPITFLKCSEDHAMPPAVQQVIADRLKSEARGMFREDECASGHDPFLSQPRVLCEKVMAAIEASKNY
jgi:homoserine acetyltransferase